MKNARLHLQAGLFFLLCTTMPVPAQTILRTVPGSSANQLGTAVSEYRDYNADGYQDILVGAPGDSAAGSGRGSIRVYSGKYLLDGVGPAVLKTTYGLLNNSGFGQTICPVNDFTGDGILDYAVGTPLSDHSAVNGGGVQLINGATLSGLGDTTGSSPQA